MKTLYTVVFCATLGIGVSGCGKRIDDSQIESIVHVTEKPELIGGATPGYGRLVQIEFSAPAKLANALEDVDAIYPRVGFCPLDDKTRIIALGPYLVDGHELLESTDNLKRDSQGRVRYRLFLVPTYPMPAVEFARSFVQQPYDLNTDPRQLCLKLESTGFFFERVQTNTMKLPSGVVANALAIPPR